MLLRVLLAADPPPLLSRLSSLLDGRDVDLVTARDTEEIWRILKDEDIDILVVSLERAPEPVEEWIGSVRRLPDRPEIILLSEREDPSRRAGLLAAGALAVLNSRLPDREVRETFQTLVRRRREDATSRLSAELLEKRYRLADFISQSPAMRAVLSVARRIADSDSSLLVLGETGVGKERLARAVHQEGPRAGGPFIAVNCGAIPEGLLESELFGHEQGAFTGATRGRRGLFELAHGGTLFLDEIGDIPLHLQVKLLRALEERQIRRLGSERSTPVSARIIAATNRDLEQEVAARRFRSDLFYRLAVVTLVLPPVRERAEDVPALVDHYVEHFRGTLNRPAARVRPEAMAALLAYSWPGNVRELVNVLERAVLISEDGEVGLRDLPPNIAGTGASPLSGAHGDWAPGQPMESFLDRPLAEVRREVQAGFERSYLSALLERNGGRIGDTARQAGISERSLYDLMRKLNLRKEDFKTVRPDSNRK